MTATVALGGRSGARARGGGSAWDLLLAITVRDLRVKYHGTVLSYFWWLARPLTMGVILYFALDRVLKFNVPHPAVFLLSALFPWFWFQGALHASTQAFIANNGLVKKVRFPRIILPLSVVLGATVEFVATLPVLTLLVAVSAVEPSWTWLVGIPLLVALQLALLAGLGVFVAAANVFFRDLAPALDSAMTLLFYATPIIYPLSRVPDGMRQLLQVNPMTPLIEAWRGLFLDGEMPGPEIWPAAVFALIAIAVGLFVLDRADASLADAL